MTDTLSNNNNSIVLDDDDITLSPDALEQFHLTIIKLLREYYLNPEDSAFDCEGRIGLFEYLDMEIGWDKKFGEFLGSPVEWLIQEAFLNSECEYDDDVFTDNLKAYWSQLDFDFLESRWSNCIWQSASDDKKRFRFESFLRMSVPEID